MAEDHPHAYGDKAFSYGKISFMIGSSPRVWGQVSSVGFPIACCRIIPTRMGTSYRRHLLFVQKKDHPHAYGDKFSIFPVFSKVSGSSPRVWGQDFRCCYRCFKIGIIPTRMGTSPQTSLQQHKTQDHPHAYGDKLLFLCFPLYLRGSSPRVWGQAVTSVGAFRFPRIIPTRMGTRTVATVVHDCTRDHPHAYGDKKFGNCSAITCRGSSPRVWGQVLYAFPSGASSRIIPTRMGTSFQRFKAFFKRWDHPHAYGDKHFYHL